MQKLLNFDVTIQPRNGGYYTRVVASPAGEANAEFELPFTGKDLEILVLKVIGSVGRTRRRARQIESQERRLLEDFGGQLFQAAFSGPVRSCLDRSLVAADSRNAGLRIRLRLAPALANIPWEYLYDREYGFVSMSPETALVRYVEMPRPVQPFPVSPPLRILAMIAAPGDAPGLQGDEEWDKLSAALSDLTDRGMVRADRLEDGTLAALQRPLRQREYHVLHFVGHGVYDEDAQDGVLALEGAGGRTRLVTGRDLGMMLKGHRSLRLVVLNACEGARSARDDPFGGVAQALVRQGIPAVIAMQFEISDPAALVFSQSFYQAIADGLPLDVAMVEARRAMFAEGHEVEWATPVLYLRSPDGRVFLKSRVPDTERTAQEQEATSRAREEEAVRAQEEEAVRAREEEAARKAQQEEAARKAQEDELRVQEKRARSTGDAGDAAAARDQFAALLPVRERVSGPEHPDTLVTRGNLARWTGAAGDVAGARDQFAALLPVFERVLGPEHPDTLTARSNLAYWTGECGDSAEALRLFRELLPDRVRVLGRDHPNTLAARRSIAFWTFRCGGSAEALRLFRELLPDQVRVLGRDHPDTLTTRANIAHLAGEG
jgi:CHAT domain/Tetratricopeptide repeat